MLKNDAYTNDLDSLGFLLNNQSDGTKNLEMILEIIPSAIALVNIDGKLTYVNRRGMELYGINYTGFNMDERISKIKALKLEDGRPFLLEEIPVYRSLNYGQVVRNVEMIIRNVNGTRYPINVSSAPLRDSQGNISGAVIIFEDFSERNSAKKELAESERKFRTIVSTANEGVWMVGNQRQTIYVNDKMAEMLGYTPQEMLALPWQAVIPEGDHIVSDHNYLKRKQGQSDSYEWQFKHKNGNLIWVLINAAPYSDTAGNIGSISLITDITARKRHERQQALLAEITCELVGLNPSTETMDRLCAKIGRYFGAVRCRFAELTKGFECAIASYGWNAGGAPSLRGTYRLGDFLSDEQLAKNNAGELSIVCDTQRDPRVSAGMCRALGIMSFIIVPLSRDGRRYYRLSIIDNKPREWRDDEVALMQEIIDRIWTYLERARTEEALQESQAQLKAELEDTKLLQSISTRLLSEDNIQALYEKIIDAAMGIMRSEYASMQMLYPEGGCGGELRLLAYRGFTPQAARFWEWVGMDSAGSTCGKALRDGKQIIVADVENCDYMQGTEDLTMFRQTGIRACQTTPLISRHGKLVGMISTHWRSPHQPSERDLRLWDILIRQAADLIDRKQAEEELRKADRNKNQFISSLSHELRNPLASMMMSLSLLKMTDPDSHQAMQAQEVLERQTVQLSRLVDDLLEVTRITQNKIKLKRDDVELANLISRTINDYRPMFAEKGVGLEFAQLDGPIYLKADPARLTQVLGNLLHNALKFTDPGGKTQVAVAKDDEKHEVTIKVIDDGFGIKPDLLKELFQPFIQADISLDRSSGGLGLGLAIVKGMVELHGGSVSVHSEGLGQGSAFSICLPLPVDYEKKHEIKRQKQSKANRSQKVLVIDDIKDVAEIMCSLLEYLGHEATSALNGIKGLAKAKDFEPDVIFCDIGLPGMSGYDVARIIRKDERLKDIYLIALSGYASQEDLAKSKEAGFNLHLAKPVDLATLEQILTINFTPENRETIGA
ncbi:PAS domain S-box protein [Desulfosporosinus sp. PR]|uniref:PAS domain S-box protein n=1 Tax=Candidatus Desulfosporosinus nitrosoreducens TaxID=3401928 RepID=UPI0027FFF59F|nr:PAS domain S-box protein [Desulfosporosinus sp. PR]MDQ7093555.1 PAS domain S-box protein [Desulfosporosinus sp. PR]